MLKLHRLRVCTLRGSTAGIAVALCAFGGSAPANAQDETPPETATAREDQRGLEEIIVTAERRTSDAQRTAASVTVQSGEDLLARGKFTLKDILETVPGVAGGESEGVSNEPTGNDSPAAGITIRGVSSNGTPSGATLSGTTAVALYVDDVYGGIGGSYDVDRVEVLRGPQGTLYGRSATAGLVAIHTRNPDLGDLSVEGTVEGGSFDLLHVTGAVNVPIIENELGLRIAANHYERDGADVERGYGASNTTEAKAKLLFEPSDGFSLLLGGAFQDRRLYNGGIVASLTDPDKPGTFEYQPSDAGTANTQFRQVWAEAKLDIGDLRLTYLPAFRTWKQDAEIFVVGPGGSIIRQTVDTPHDEFVTQELRLSSDGDSSFKWQTGLFYYYNDLRSTNTSEWNSSGGLLFSALVNRETRDLGAFAEGTLALTEGLRITAGARYDKNTVETAEDYTSNLNGFCNTLIGGSSPSCPAGPANGPDQGLPEDNVTITLTGDEGRRVFKNVTYKVRAEYDVGPSNLLYASVSTAFNPGDVQIGTGAGNLPFVYAYDAEKLTAYEIGSKNRFLDGRLQVNAGVFHYDYAGYQAHILLNTSDPSSGILFSVPLRMTGAELETLFLATPLDRIGFNLSKISSKFHDRPADFAEVAANKGLWGFPSTTATLFYDHEFPLSGGSSVNFHAEGIYRGAYAVEATSEALTAQGGMIYNRQEAIVLGNADVTWTSADNRFSITGYVRNITDKRYKTYMNLQTVTPFQATGTQSDPRAFGVVVTARY